MKLKLHIEQYIAFTSTPFIYEFFTKAPFDFMVASERMYFIAMGIFFAVKIVPWLNNDDDETTGDSQ